MIVAAGASLWPLPTAAQSQRAVTKLAEGVYEIQHASRPAQSGNTTVIIGDRQVFVVDTCFLPSAAKEDIAQIRKWTDKPVSFVLNTHFHNDHNNGNRAYMDAFPAVTIIAHAEAQKEMDMFGPSSARRYAAEGSFLQKMLDSGKANDGTSLSAEEIDQVKQALTRRQTVEEELRSTTFQSATLTFDHDFTIDLGRRKVEVRFLGRGNTAGDAMLYLPKEKILVAGDVVVSPIPYILDGYPSEWVRTLERIVEVGPAQIVPGHGPVMHDTSYVLLLRDLLQSAVDQLNAELVRTSPALAQTLNQVKDSIDLSSFRQRFAGGDKNLDARFDDMVQHLVKAAFTEASLR